MLVGAGLSYRATIEGLNGLGVPPESLAGILLTHDHKDHSYSAGALRRKLGVGLYANECTALAAKRKSKVRAEVECNIFKNGSEFGVGALRVVAFQIPHDGTDTVGFVIACGSLRLGVATDLGHVTPQVVSRLRDCDALILETNHDPDMLRQAKRHEYVKRRALGRNGHLSNGDAAELLAAVLCPRLKAVFMFHLSRHGNTPALAERALADVLTRSQRKDVRLVITYPDKASAVINLPEAS